MSLKISGGPLILGRGGGLQIKTGGTPIPKTVAGLVAWWKADAGTDTTVNGASVGSWTDQSGNNIAATQATGSVKPTYVSSWQNGKPALAFSAAAFQRLAFPVLASLTNWTIIIAYDAASVTGNNYLFGGNGKGLFSSASALGPGWGGYDGTNARRSNAQATVAAVRTFQQAHLFENGTEVGYNATGTVGAIAFSVIASQSSANLTHDGKIGEILVYNSTLGTTDRLTEERYIGARFGFTVA